MKWWLKAIMACIVFAVVLVGIGFFIEWLIPEGNFTEAQGDKLSELFGTLYGLGFFVIWAWFFSKRGSSDEGVPETALESDENVVLENQRCGYLKSGMALFNGSGLITDRRLIWKPNSNMISQGAVALYRTKPLSIPLLISGRLPKPRLV
ncbi:MAG: hypothetical protein JXR40_09295 [Pontiellaceae bacterium]|nr:hypothetical protein [Pontiellaceae bacterium]